MSQAAKGLGRTVATWVSQEEHRALERYAKGQGLKLSAWVRRALLGVVGGQAPPEVVADPERTLPVPAELANGVAEPTPLPPVIVPAPRPPEDPRALMWLSVHGVSESARDAKAWCVGMGVEADEPGLQAWAKTKRAPLGVAGYLLTKLNQKTS